MARRNLDKNSFVAGELSPRVYGRTDLAQYGQGSRKAENILIHPHGGASGRPGTKFVATTKYPLKRARLLPFQVSTEATYTVEAGDLYFRFYVNNGLLLDSGSSIVEVVTPWDENDVWLLQVAQEADVMYIVHPDFTPRKLSRTSVDTFVLTEVTWNEGRAPLGPFNLDPTNDIVTANAGVTYDRRIIITNDAFEAADVGRHFYSRNTTQKRSAFYIIRQFIDAKTIEVDDLFQNPSAQHPTGTDLWSMGLFSDGFGCNAVAFHEGRLGFGGFKRQVDSFAVSVSDDFENFEIESPDPDLTDADNADKAIFRRTVSNQVNAIRWMRSVADQLIIGTSGAEFKVRGDNEDSLTPSGTTVKVVTARGSTELPGIVVDNNIFFVQRSNTTLRQFGFSLAADGLSSKNFSILSDHIIKNGGGVTGMAYQQDPISMLWLPRIDGQLLSWSFELEQEISGPSRHIFGGNYLGGIARCESVEVQTGAVDLNPRTDQTGFGGPITGTLTNPGFEAGATTGWTAVSGTWSAVASVGAVTPQEGSYLLNHTATTADATLRQDLDLTTLSGFNTVLVDEGQTTIDFSVWVTRYATTDLQVQVSALNSAGDSIAILYDSGDVEPTTGVWEELAATAVELPPTARQLRFDLIANPSISVAGACFDNLTATVTQGALTFSTAFTGNSDQLWVIVKRTINGSTTRSVEYMEQPWSLGLDQAESDELKRDRMDDAFFVDSGSTIDIPITPSDITKTDPAVVTSAAHGLSNGDRVRFRHIIGMTEINQRRYLVANKTTNTFELTTLAGVDVDATGYGTFQATEDAAFHLEFNTVSGLTHLEGETVSILLDGTTHPSLVVASGAITLTRYGSIAHIGLGYTSVVETMGAHGGNTDPLGSDIGDPVKISSVVVNMLDTIGVKYGRGTNPAVFEQISFTPDVMDRSPVPFTGFKKVPLGGSHQDFPSITFKQDLPLPFQVLALYIKYLSNAKG